MTGEAVWRIVAWAGLALVVLGAAAAWRAWSGDRSRGLRRCGGCWYDMSGAPGLRCPECGHEAQDERGLRRTRRRWGRLAAGLALAALGAAAVARKAAREGWPSLLPEFMLVHALKPSGEEGDYLRGYHWATREMARRLDADDLSGWSIGYAIERQGALRTAPCWPEGATIRVGFLMPDWTLGTLWNAYGVVPRIRLEGQASPHADPSTWRPPGMSLPQPFWSFTTVPAQRGVSELRFDCRFVLMSGASTDRPIRLPVNVGDRGPARLASQELTHRVRRAIRWAVYADRRRRDHGWTLGLQLEWPLLKELLDSGLLMRVELERGLGWEEVGVIEAHLAGARELGSVALVQRDTVTFPDEAPRAGVGEAAAARRLPPERWRVRVSGLQPADRAEWPLAQYWGGSFEIAYRECVKPEPAE